MRIFGREKADRIVVPPSQPAIYTPVMKDRIADIITRLKVQSEKLNRTSQHLQSRSKELFEQCVRAQQEGDGSRAAIYANEVAQLRKMSRTVLRSQLSLEQVVLRLETVKEFGDVVTTLGPAVNIISQIQGEIKGVMPEVARDLEEVDEMIDTVIAEAGYTRGEIFDVSVHDQEAQKILQEASEIVATRMKSSFPELPEAYKNIEQAPEAKA